jgi:ERCC4-type nuclease
MKIVIDTREQAPYSFDKYQVEVTTGGLPAGDYSLPGFEDRVAIERKSLDDLIGCLMNSNRDRFERELSKLRFYDFAAVVVEAPLEDVSRGRYRSEMKSHAAVQSIVTFQVRYRVPFMWCGNRDGGEYITHSLLSKYLYEIHKRYQLSITTSQPNPVRRSP